MSVTLEYKPDKGVVYAETFIPWGTTRQKVRETLRDKYESNDQEFADLTSRRDIYKELQGQSVFIFFNYDTNNQFSELEIHSGIQLNIRDKTLNFQMLVRDAVEILGEISLSQKTIGEGETLFVDLKLSVSSGASMGDDQEDNMLSYIYCAQDISHLLD